MFLIFLVLKRDVRAVTRAGCMLLLIDAVFLLTGARNFYDIMKYLCPIAENRDILICKMLIQAAEAVM